MDSAMNGPAAGAPELRERLFRFALRIIKLCQRLDQTPGTSRTIANQLLRAGTSVGANYEEGQGGQSRADFISKTSIALKEAREANYWLRLVAAAELLSPDLLSELIDESAQITRILGAIVARSSKKFPPQEERQEQPTSSP